MTALADGCRARAAQPALGAAPRRPAAPRILFLNQSGVMGGGEWSLLDIARHFRGSGKVILLADGPLRAHLAEAGVAVALRTPGAALSTVSRADGLAADLRALPGLAALVARVAREARQAEVIYANSQKAMVVAGLAGLWARRPVIWHLRDLMGPEHFSAGHRRLAALMANRLASRVIANSAATRDALVAAGGRAERIAVVHNGIGEAAFAPESGRDLPALRGALGLGPGPVIGIFGRLAQWKGQRVFLDALEALPGVQGLVVGDALFAPDRDYAEALHAAAARPGLAGRVHLLGQRDDVPHLLRLCDVVVHASVAPEPFGRVIVEGMLAGRPVVASRAGGVSEILEDGRTGLLVPPGDADALAAAVRSLLQDTAGAAALAGRGQAAARERFSLGAMLAGVEREVAQATRRS